MRALGITFFFCALLLGGVALLVVRDPDIAGELGMATKTARTTIHLRESLALSVKVADTPTARVTGLSGSAPLADNHGLLFVFEEDGYPAIWMKDMRFAIDIIWVDREGEIVDIAQNVSPDSYPQTFKPRAPARYVVEVNAGYVESRSVVVGDQTDIAKKFPPGE